MASAESSISHDRVTYVRWNGNNFGDNLNDLYFRDVLGIKNACGNVQELENGIFVIGFGTIFNGYLKQGKNAKLIIFGPGYGIITQTPRVECSILFVRGPLTCKCLGLPLSFAITDGAYLLRDKIFSFASEEKKIFKYGLIPHHNFFSKKTFTKAQNKNENLQLIDPTLPVPDFIKKVAQCEKFICESLHGAILADILSIPFCIRQTSPHFDSFKFLDWTSSVEIDLNLEGLLVDEIKPADFDNAVFTNSRQHIKEERYKLLFEKEEELKYQVLNKNWKNLFFRY